MPSYPTYIKENIKHPPPFIHPSIHPSIHYLPYSTYYRQPPSISINCHQSPPTSTQPTIMITRLHLHRRRHITLMPNSLTQPIHPLQQTILSTLTRIIMLRTKTFLFHQQSLINPRRGRVLLHKTRRTTPTSQRGKAQILCVLTQIYFASKFT